MVKIEGKSLQLNGNDTTIGKLKDAVVYRFAELTTTAGFIFIRVCISQTII